jgi:acyl-CoA thioesterase-1
MRRRGAGIGTVSVARASDVAPFILAFGDSLTSGHGLAAADSFPAQLEALLRATHPGAYVRNAGVSGDTTASGLARLPRLLSRLDRRPDLAIVELGANDMLRFVDPPRIRHNLDVILDQFGRCGIPVLLAGMMAPLLLGALASRLNAIYPDLAAKHGLPLYPFFLKGAIGQGLSLRDGIHPNARAIGIVARGILPAVVAALATPAAAAA